MRRYILLCLLSFSIIGKAQKPIELSKPISIGGTNNSCGGYILKPGFSFKASSNNNLSFGIDKLICADWKDNITYDNDGYPINYKLDKGKEVGEIAYEKTVMPNGSVAFTVPIKIYPGRDGFQPNISLSYNSLSDDGPLGFGWSIGGLSQISKVNRSTYYDGKMSSSLDEKSPLSLDGIHITGSTTERGNIDIFKGINSHIAAYPNGTKAIFSNTNGIIYPVTRIFDMRGNYIDYKYILEGNIHYITEINYGGLGDRKTLSSSDYDSSKDLLHYASIKFIYSDIRANKPQYIYGVALERKKQLKEIQIYFEGHLQGSYKLKYDDYILNSQNPDYHDYVDYLRQIEYVTSNKTFNPLVFTYGSNKQESFNSKKYELKGYLSDKIDSTTLIMPVKFSSKSKDNGLIFMPAKSLYMCYKFPGTTCFGNDTAYIYKNVLTNNDLAKIPLYGRGFSGISGNFRGLQIIDYKGNGDNNILKISESTRGWKDDKCQHYFDVYDENGSLIDQYYTSLTEDNIKLGKPYNIYYSISRSYLVGDFLGKGYQDIIYITHNKDIQGGNHTSKISYFDLKQKKYIGTNTCFDLDPEDIIVPIDFDGDGVNEIAHIKKGNGIQGGVVVYKLNGNIVFNKIAEYSFYYQPTVDEKQNMEILFGDLNGDGKTDIVVSPESSRKINPSTWTILYSNGKDQFIYNPILFQGGIGYNRDSKYLLQDINGDGLPDLVIQDGKGSVTCHKNLGGSFSRSSIVLAKNIGIKSKVVLPRLEDTNKLYPIMGIIGKDLTLIENTYDLKLNRLMSSSIDSHGIMNLYKYSSLGNKDACEIIPRTTNKVEFPYNYYIDNIYVANSIEEKLDQTLISNVTYKYENPVIHRQGLGFCGFDKITMTDNIRNSVFTKKMNNLKYGILESEDSPTSNSSYEYTINIDNSKRLKIYLDKKTTLDKLNNNTITSSYTYDILDNVKTIITDYGDNIKEEKTFAYDNVTNWGFNLRGFLREESTKKTRDKKEVTTKTIVDYYDSGEFKYPSGIFLPKSKTTYYNDKSISHEDYLYNERLQLTDIDIWSYASNNKLTKKIEYDRYGRVIKETDPMGYTSEKVFGSNGLLSQTKDHRSNITRYEYDSFNRPIKTIYPDGTTEEVKFSWASNINGALYVSSTTKTGQPTRLVYYDALGREIRIGEIRFDGQYLYTDNVYDSKGRLQKTSLPFKGSTATLWNKYAYDNYDRITSLSYASGKEDTYLYSENKITSVIDNVSTTKVSNSLGETVKITDPAGIITYNYRPDGQIETIIPPKTSNISEEIIKTKINYDQYGRKIEVIDPSAGKRTYVYDSKGNIITETDADNKTTSFTYDEYDRLLSKTSDNITTTYSYKKENGLIASVSNSKRKIIYSYDNLDRIIAEKESIIDDKSIEKTFAYINGRLSSTTYKSGAETIGTENYIYANGHKAEVKFNNSASIWKLTAENSMGLSTAAVTGTLARTYGYDNFGLPTSRVVKNGNTTIQNFGYDLNPKTGNLNWRKDNNRNIQETFGYDGLNRLTSVVGKVSYTMAYDLMGNILNNSSVGSYKYNQATKPYAITDVTSNVIPSNNQKIVYNTQLRPTSISENGYVATLDYSEDGERIKMLLKKGSEAQLTRYYLGSQYEIDRGSAGDKERLYLNGDAYSSSVVYTKQNGKWELQYICRDYLGSITHVTNSQGTILQELSYDAWGRLRNPADHSLYTVYKEPLAILGRGYTGHEHLPMFGLINMNARLYDPIIGRFLSPDPYVQAPLMSQNFNRYSYGLNNPLRYTDPNGEIFWVPVILLAGGFATGYIGHGISTGNWGFQALVAGHMSMVMSGVTMGGSNALGGSISRAFGSVGNDLGTILLNNTIKPLEYSNNTFGFSLSPVALLTWGSNYSPKFNYGATASLSIKDVTFSGGATGLSKSWGISFNNETIGLGYGQTYYSKPSQQTGIVSARYKDFSLRWENDVKSLGGDGNDRYRSNATEVGYKDFFIGTNVFTNAPKDEPGFDRQNSDYISYDKKENGSKVFNNKYGTYVIGEKLSSPLYLGVKKGNQITRTGINNAIFGDLSQNGFHHLPFVKSPNYYDGNYGTNAFFQKGTYLPFTLY